MLSEPPAMTRSASLPRIAGEEGGHAGEVAIVLAGLVGAAEDDVVEIGPVDMGVAVDQRLDGDGGEIVGADISERTGVAADGGADGVADIGFGHDRFLNRSP